jgi:alpha-L-arabinofuranosidase
VGVQTASLVVDPAFQVGEVEPALFGSFVEHMGRCVYTGIYEPGHSQADPRGFRGDVLRLVEELGVTLVRYPGGNFVSGYDWEDGIGPQEERPVRLELAWHALETNRFGVDEFVDWARTARVEPLMVVNLGTRGVDEARALVEYANHPRGTQWADLRRRYGHPEPHRIRLWGLGNEMDGPWQIGHKTAAEYGRLAAETARVMRAVDPTIQLVACGSSHRGMPTFPDWEATVLDQAYEDIDHLSLHSYYDPQSHDLASFLASAVDMETFIESVIATCDHVRARKRSKKRIGLAYDEWNVWHMSRSPEWRDERWTTPKRQAEDVYTLADAVVVGSLLITLLRHADRIRIGCLAQLVNVIAPIHTEPRGPAWRQTIFHPFAQAARWGRGQSLRLEPVSPSCETQAYGRVPCLHAAATLDRTAGELAIFAVNRSPDEAILLDCDLRPLSGATPFCHWTLTGDPAAVNTAEQPDAVTPRCTDPAPLDDGHLSVTLPALSWNVLRFRVPS